MIKISFYEFDATLLDIIDDGLMAVFFLLLGLEIKRQTWAGELSSLRAATLPIAAAIGGMVVPALVYVMVAGSDGARGWAVPMATDIAFALAVLALLGPSIPVALKVFLTALAIIGDLGALRMIAVLSSTEISWGALAGAGGALLALIVLNQSGVRRLSGYLLVGSVLWYFLLLSGLHATIAGVLLATTIPSRLQIDPCEFLRCGRGLLDEFAAAGDCNGTVLATPEHCDAVAALRGACAQVEPPLQRLERALQGPVAFFILPLFALANAGVRLRPVVTAQLTSPIALGVIVGLVIGKPLGICLFSWLAVRMRWSELPSGVTGRALLGAAALSGVGFTMSLFIAALAFRNPAQLNAAKVGILVGSGLAALTGGLILRRCARPTVSRLDAMRPAVERAAVRGVG